MNSIEAIAYAWKNLARRSLRSWLTIIGLVIGVIAIVTILSISEGFNNEIKVQMSSFGADQMVVYPIGNIAGAMTSGGGTASLMQTSGKLRQADVDDVKSIPGVKNIMRSLFGRVSLSFKGKNITAFVVGADPVFFDMYPDYIQVESGREFKETDRNVAFFANDAANTLFGKDKVMAGSVVQLNGRNYRVVGIQKKIGTTLSKQDDSQIIIPFEDAKTLFAGQFLSDEVGMMLIQVDEGYNPEDIKSIIEQKLAANHRVKMDDLDFSVITSKQIMDIVSTVLVSIQVVLGAVTLIASVVGAIGIANTMFMNVLERVQEIGILKSVGATRNDILTIFLVEAAIIGLAGGIIGLVSGYGLLGVLGDVFGIPWLLTPGIVAFVFLFAVGTGAAAGFIPAWRASKLDPIEAFRYD
jgi:putative ABC transport system permease protein